MATTSNMTPSKANTTPAPTSTERETHRNVRLTNGEMQE